MAKRPRKQPPSAPGARPDRAAASGNAPPAVSFDRPPAPAGSTALLPAVMMFLVPSLGVPGEEMLQDTLKSALVSFMTLAAALVFFWRLRHTTARVQVHAVMLLPLLLLAHALGSMVWSHAYLAGVEAVRWFVFALLLATATQVFTRERLPWLALGIHAGAVIASLWAALQFWAGLKLFPQGPNPGSTFINRNFFAEYAVCTLPFGLLLALRARQSAARCVSAASLGLVVVAILMTGTRSALIALWLQALAVLPFLAWRYRQVLGLRAGAVALVLGTLAVTIGALGSIASGNASILAEERGTTALERGLRRTGSIGPTDTSLGIRMLMWNATGHVIRANPILGVGAGAWEREMPRYQEGGAQLETDYYAHNEYLQLIAEYGVVGWVFIAGVLAWLSRAAVVTVRGAARPDTETGQEGPWRAAALTSLLALLIVSSIGFPWRMAATGALFALMLALLCASDLRLGAAGHGWHSREASWKPTWSRAALGATAACLLVASWITYQAAESERLLVRATRIALTITRAGDWNHPRWNPAKAEMLRLVREGIAVNPHYRKITPMVADELARWGDWTNAIWIWDSVLQSRPFITAIITNVARGHLATERPELAREYLERARRLQPDAPAVRSLDVILLARQGRSGQALAQARDALDRGIVDYDLTQAAFVLAVQARDGVLARQAMELRAREWPTTQVDAHLQLGQFFATTGADPVQALQAFSRALELADPARRAAVLDRMPPAYRSRLAAPGTPAADAQTSASKG